MSSGTESGCASETTGIRGNLDQNRTDSGLKRKQPESACSHLPRKVLLMTDIPDIPGLSSRNGTIFLPALSANSNTSGRKRDSSQPLNNTSATYSRVIKEAQVSSRILSQYLHSKNIGDYHTVLFVRPHSKASDPSSNDSAPLGTVVHTTEPSCSISSDPLRPTDTFLDGFAVHHGDLLLQASQPPVSTASTVASPAISNKNSCINNLPVVRDVPSLPPVITLKDAQPPANPTMQSLLQEVQDLRQMLKISNLEKVKLGQQIKTQQDKITSLETQLKQFQEDAARPVLLSDFSPIMQSLMKSSHGARFARDVYGPEHLDLAARVYSQSRLAYQSLLTFQLPFPPVRKVVELLRLDKISAGSDGPHYTRVPTVRKGIPRTYFTLDQLQELNNILSLIPPGGQVPKELKADLAVRFDVSEMKINRWFNLQKQKTAKEMNQLIAPENFDGVLHNTD